MHTHIPHKIRLNTIKEDWLKDFVPRKMSFEERKLSSQQEIVDGFAECSGSVYIEDGVEDCYVDWSRDSCASSLFHQFVIIENNIHMAWRKTCLNEDMFFIFRSSPITYTVI